jgi:hypothetical protein
MSTQSRDQIRERINKTRSVDPVEIFPIFASSSRELTHKQKRFAELIANGETASNAYRLAYNTRAKPHLLGNDAHKLKKKPKIINELNRLNRMNELKKYRSSEQIKALIVDSLIDIIEDKSNSNPNQIINASKVLGSVVGIDLFKETSKPLTIINSDDIKNELMSEIKALINNDTTIRSDDDVIDLLEEINSSPSDEPPIGGSNVA